ncbi:MAG: class I SAM-dependent methyltransferase [Proteobacteria bacterium]|nr:class I SAM-dependent methyltransferase [Pseudomonadota bacterium]
MNGQGEEKEVLNGQQSHWKKVYTENADMFGKEPSCPARRAAELFGKGNVKRILELGSGQGRDTLFFARHGFKVYALDYSEEGLDAMQKKADAIGASGSLTTIYHDVRQRLPFDDDFFDGCYSHMLYCMALTTPELEFLSQEVRRILKPGALNIYTVRHTADPHYRTGIDRGDNMWEIGGGFVVHFFSREKVVHLAKDYEIIGVEEFEETDLPKKLFLITLKKN